MLKIISASALSFLALAAAVPAHEASAQQTNPTYGDERPTRTRARANDAYRPGPDQPGLGVLGSDGRAVSEPAYGAQQPSYSAPTYGSAPQAYAQTPAPSYSGAPQYSGQQTYGSPTNTSPAYSQGFGAPPPYQAPYGQSGGNDAYRSIAPGGYTAGQGGFGQPYSPPPAYDDGRNDRRPYMSGQGHRGEPPPGEYRDGNSYSTDEIINAGHGFFGSITKGLGSVIEHAHRRKGRPNGYILGEEAGGAFIGGLRYGRGRLYTKDAGVHNVYWQGPSIGFDAGADGSKVMILVYGLRDTRDIYERFGGIDGSAYVVGGVGMTFMSREHVVMAPIRSGVGLRFGANVGYLKFTSQPTWNPF